MSYQKLTSMLKSAKLRPNDRLWFGRWVDGYRRFCRVGPNDSIPINRESVIGFLRQQNDQGERHASAKRRQIQGRARQG